MKTLIIHPTDRTTFFLNAIYLNQKWDAIHLPVSDDFMKKQLRNHERIIMLGHGSAQGLFGRNGFMINDEHAEILREKEGVYVWCHANKFVERNGLHGFNTGMIISELNEAIMYDVTVTKSELTKSNWLFAEAIRSAVNSPNMVDDVRKLYNGNSEVIQFNRQNLFYSQLKTESHGKAINTLG